MPSKCVMILLDGLGDRSYERFGFRTPLQAADTPCLDRLASRGANGLFHAGMLGRPYPSEMAHFSLFGYPISDFPGRGALEALGSDVPLDPTDVAVLAHFVNVRNEDGQLRLMYDRMCGTEEEIDGFIDAIKEFESDGVKIKFHSTKRMFGVLTMHGDIGPCFTDSNPMVDGTMLSEVVPLLRHSSDERCVRAAAALKKYLVWAYEKLSQAEVNKIRVKQGLPPANALVTQRAGQMKHVVPFPERFGLKALSIASGYVYSGIAKYLGMDFFRAVDSGDPGIDISKRLAEAREALDQYDFIHVHTKAPDRAAHSKNPSAKRGVIEALDRGISQVIDEFLGDPEVLVVVTADHSTPSAGRMIHSGEPVPMTFVGKGVRRDNVTSFDEISAATGCLGMVRGTEVMHMILNNLDMARLRGIWDAPDQHEFWPGNYQPFTLPGTPGKEGEE